MEPDRCVERQACRWAMSIWVWWIGERTGSVPLLERVGSRLATEFECDVRIWNDASRPTGLRDQARGQYSSRQMLAWLVERRPPDAHRILGLTDVDLFIPVLTFVFGEAQLEGTAAVVSTFRLVDASEAMTAARLVKESLHEVGHTFGLVHCSARCVMARSASVGAVDAKPTRLCAACRQRYRLHQQDGIYVTETENPDRR